MPRELVWMDQPRFRGGAAPTLPVRLSAKLSTQLRQNFESHRDKEFASHACAKHPREPTPTQPKTYNGVSFSTPRTLVAPAELLMAN